MIRSPFNDAWRVAPKLSAFAALAGAGAPAVTVTLPHDAMRDLERDPSTANSSHTGYFPGSHVTFEKSFDVPDGWRDKSVTIEFEGVYRDAMVYVNGDFVAQRPNGYFSFAAVLDPYLKFGAENTIRVEARSHEDSRWYSGTGVHRDVWLLVSDPVHVERDGVRVTTPSVEDALATVAVAVSVVNGSRQTRTVRASSTVTAPDRAGSHTATAPLTLLPGTTATVHLKHFVDEPLRWSVDAPHLYRLDVQIVEDGEVLDESVVDFGIRTIQVDPRQGLRINGETIKLRGGCVHHDNGPLGAAAIARAEERRVQILKDAGYNAIRSAHNPMSRAMLDACDRLGMLVIDELSDVWTEGKTSFDYSVDFAEWWERDAASLVAKDFNHPSVIMYSIGNEIFEVGRPIGATIGRAIAERLRELDGTRIVTNAINGLVAAFDLVAAAAAAGGSDEPMDVNSMIAAMGDMMNGFGASEPVSDRTEEAHSQLDASGINYAEARYEVDAARHPDRVSYGSETFPGALDRLWALVEKHPQVIGDFAWTAWDYLGEAGVGRVVYADDPVQPTGISSPYPWLVAGCGTVDITGQRRPISYWREVVWGLRSAPYIAVHRPQHFDRQVSVGPWAWDDVLESWSWDVPAGSPVRVDVYVDADEVELLMDGVPAGRAEVGAEKAFIARFTTAYAPGSLTAVAYRHGRETGRTELRTAGEARLSAIADRTTIASDGTDLAFVDIALRDLDGIVFNDAIAQVRVSVEGPAVLAGFASAQPDSTERFDASTRTTFDGRVLAVVRPTGPGAITLVASADGYADETLTISAT